MGGNYGVLYHLVSLYHDPCEAEMQRFYPSDLGLAPFQALIDGDFVPYLVFSIKQSISRKIVPGNENDLVLQASQQSENTFWTRPEAQCQADQFLLPSSFLRYKIEHFENINLY